MKFAHLLIFFFILTLGCASAPPTTEKTRLGEASEWTGSALQLPAGSPIVLELKPQRAFSGVRDLKDWFVAEPENWGNEGARMARLAELYWGLLSTYAGGDPAVRETWHGLGIDPTKSLLLSVYAMDPDSTTWFEGVEEAYLRKEGFGKVSGGSLEPLIGFRVIVPVHNTQTLKNFANDLATTLGYQTIHWEHLQEGRTAYASAHPEDPWFSLFVSGDELIADFVFLQRGTAEEGSELIRRAVAQRSGAPNAPRPPVESDLAIGFDQLGVSRLAKTLGYVRAISTVRGAKAEIRDEEFYKLVSETQKDARAWELRHQRIPGLTYALTMSKAAGTRLEMTFVLDPAGPKLTIPKLERGLRIQDQGLGLMVDFSILNQPDWKSILSLENTDEAVSIVGAGDDDSELYAFVFPRNLALIAGNIVDAGPDGFSENWAPLIAALPTLQRLEISVPDVVSGQVDLYATFREDARSDLLQDTARSLVIFLNRLRVWWVAGAPPLNIGGLEPEVLQPVPFGSSEGFALYSPKNQELLLSTGTKELAAETQKSLSDGEFAGSDAIYIRMEPASLVTYLTQVSPGLLPAIQTGRLAQRTGPWIFRMGPDSKNGRPMIRWSLEISPPPSLE